jgi:hypothetical protein
MIATIDEWLQGVASRPAASIARPVRAVGIHDRHVGPKWDFAQIDVVAEPADEWSVEVE